MLSQPTVSFTPVMPTTVGDAKPALPRAYTTCWKASRDRCATSASRPESPPPLTTPPAPLNSAAFHLQVVARPCLDCGTPSPRTPCPGCTPAREAQRPPRRAKGRYDTKWLKLRALVIRQKPWCAVCFSPGTPANPLTGDHVVALANGGRNVRANVQVLCLACNSAKRDRVGNSAMGLG